MKISCGTDIIEISRIKEAIDGNNVKFQTNVFTPSEIDYCESHRAQRYQHYAARFAAKEAIFKALSDKLYGDYSWTDFEVVNDESGKPEVKLHIDIPDLEDISVSLSHCKEYAIANVTVMLAK